MDHCVKYAMTGIIELWCSLGSVFEDGSRAVWIIRFSVWLSCIHLSQDIRALLIIIIQKFMMVAEVPREDSNKIGCRVFIPFLSHCDVPQTL